MSQKGKCCLWNIFQDYSNWLLVVIKGDTPNKISPTVYNCVMMKVYKNLNGLWCNIMIDIFKLKGNTYDLQNFRIFQKENHRSLKYGPGATSYRVQKLLQQVPNDICQAVSLALFENCIKTWECEDFSCRSWKIFIQSVEYSWSGPISKWW